MEMTNEQHRAESLKQYVADFKAGVEPVKAFRAHKERMGELEAYDAGLARQARRMEERSAFRKKAGCVR